MTKGVSVLKEEISVWNKSAASKNAESVLLQESCLRGQYDGHVLEKINKQLASQLEENEIARKELEVEVSMKLEEVSIMLGEGRGVFICVCLCIVYIGMLSLFLLIPYSYMKYSYTHPYIFLYILFIS